jgi:hypothetical protein
MSFLGCDDTLAVSSSSRALREIVKRASSKLRARVTNVDEISTCLRAWPSVTRLIVSRPGSGSIWCCLPTITELVLEDAVVPLDCARLFAKVRTLSLVRCYAVTLEFPELVSLSITAPIGGEFPSRLPRTVRSVHCSDVSLGILGPISRLPAIETLSLTRPHPSESVPSPFAVIGSMETLRSLTLRHFDAMNVHIAHTARDEIKMRLETLCIHFCLVCADDPLLAYSHQCKRSNHECSEYTRRVEINAKEGMCAANEDPISSYETYVLERLACPLINHQYGLRMLFSATLAEFEETHAATVRNAMLLVATS